MKSYTINEMVNSELWRVLVNDHQEDIVEDFGQAFTILGLNWHMIMNGFMAYDTSDKQFVIIRDASFYQKGTHHAANEVA